MAVNLGGLRDIFKIPELSRRIFITLGFLALYRVGVHIPTPGINSAALGEFFRQMQGTLFGMVDLFAGGAFFRSLSRLFDSPAVSSYHHSRHYPSIAFLSPSIAFGSALSRKKKPGCIDSGCGDHVPDRHSHFLSGVGLGEPGPGIRRPDQCMDPCGKHAKPS